jgi:hypothetical protein
VTPLARPLTGSINRCRICGCTDDNACIVHPIKGRLGRYEDEMPGVTDDELDIAEPCHWVELDLCSGCVSGVITTPPATST